jgi:hypothetical protein
VYLSNFFLAINTGQRKEQAVYTCGGYTASTAFNVPRIISEKKVLSNRTMNLIAPE